MLQDGDGTLDLVEAIGSGDRELASHLERDRVWRGGGRLCAEDGVEIGAQPVGVERLGDDTGRAELLQCIDFGRPILRRQKDDRNIFIRGGLPQRADRSRPVEIGHHDVEQHGVEPVARCCGNPVTRILVRDDLRSAIAFEGESYETDHLRIIVDQQNSHRKNHLWRIQQFCHR